MLHLEKRSVRPSSLPSALRLFALYREESTTKGILFDNCGGRMLASFGAFGFDRFLSFVTVHEEEILPPHIWSFLPLACGVVVYCRFFIVASSRVCLDVVEKVAMVRSLLLWFSRHYYLEIADDRQFRAGTGQGEARVVVGGG
jgi:hypothetical protein